VCDLQRFRRLGVFCRSGAQAQLSPSHMETIYVAFMCLFCSLTSQMREKSHHKSYCIIFDMLNCWWSWSTAYDWAQTVSSTNVLQLVSNLQVNMRITLILLVIFHTGLKHKYDHQAFEEGLLVHLSIIICIALCFKLWS